MTTKVTTPVATRVLCHHLRIRMGDNQWGNELMYELAERAFRRLDGIENLVVEVVEHAGWFLDFTMINGKIRTVGTANDMAYFPEFVREHCRKFNGCEWKYLGTVDGDTMNMDELA